MVKARQRVERGMTELQPGTAWSETTITKDGKAARAKAQRAAVSVLSGARVARPREEERGRRAWRHPPGFPCRWARGGEALRRGDATQCATARPQRKVSPPLAPPSRASYAPRASAPFSSLAPIRPLTNSAPASQPRLPAWPRPHAAHCLPGNLSACGRASLLLTWILAGGGSATAVLLRRFAPSSRYRRGAAFLGLFGHFGKVQRVSSRFPAPEPCLLEMHL